MFQLAVASLSESQGSTDISTVCLCDTVSKARKRQKPHSFLCKNEKQKALGSNPTRPVAPDVTPHHGRVMSRTHSFPLSGPASGQEWTIPIVLPP
jgi:hypothetical protein